MQSNCMCLGKPCRHNPRRTVPCPALFLVVLVHSHTHNKELLPDIQMEPPVFQCVAGLEVLLWDAGLPKRYQGCCGEALWMFGRLIPGCIGGGVAWDTCMWMGEERRKIISSLESWSWKGALGSPQENLVLKAAPPRRSDHVALGFLQPGLEKPKVCKRRNLSGHPAPFWRFLMSRKVSLSLQRELGLFQGRPALFRLQYTAVKSLPLPCHHGGHSSAAGATQGPHSGIFPLRVDRRATSLLLVVFVVLTPCARWEDVIGCEETASICTRGGLDWISGRVSSQKGWLGIGMGCPGKWWGCHPFRYLRDVWMQLVGTRFSSQLVVLGGWLNLMIFRVFSNLNDSMRMWWGRS